MGRHGGRGPVPPDRLRSPFRRPAILMQDFTGVPVVADLAAMRDAMVALGGDPWPCSPRCRPSWS